MSVKSLRMPSSVTPSLEFYWNGKPLRAVPGESVAAALVAEGIKSFAKTRKSHRPMGLSGFYTNGVLARVSGVPNVRLDQVTVAQGMKVEMQNCWPSPRFDLLKLARVVPSGWIQGGFEHSNLIPSGNWVFQRWERFLAFMAGVAKPAEAGRSFIAPPGEKIVCDVLVIGGGPEGCKVANAAAEVGKSVVLVSRSLILGRGARALDISLPPLDKRVRSLLGVDVFGAYREGKMLLGASLDSSKGAYAFEADEVVLAIGQKANPPLVPGAWLPGSMDARTALLLASEHHIKPGQRVAVLGANHQQVVATRLKKLGVNIVSIAPVHQLQHILGHTQVTGVKLQGTDVQCDCVVFAGPWLRDDSLEFQGRSDGLLQLTHQRIDPFRYVGRAGDGDIAIPTAPLGRHPVLLCPCFDVSAQEVRLLLDQGITDLEVIKRLTSCGMGPCQGTPCWNLLQAFVASELQLPNQAVAKPSLRPPRRAITVAQAAGLSDAVEPLK